jgi:hypothetical protein
MIDYYSGTYNYVGIEMPKGGEMADNITSSNIRDLVQKWFMEDGWSVGVDTPPDATWALVADDGQGRKVVTGQRTGREDQLLIQGAIVFDDVISNKVSQLPEDERNNWLWDLRFELVRTDLEFSGVQLPLKRVEVMGRICFDALTKDAFLQKVSQVRKGVLMVGWMLARKFVQQPPREELGFHR